MKWSFLKTLVFLVVLPTVGQGQNNPCLDDWKTVKIDVVQKVKTFTSNVEGAVRDGATQEERKGYRERIKNQFREKAIIEISSRNSPTEILTISQYIDRLMNVYEKKYKTVVIKFEHIHIPDATDFKKVERNGEVYYVGVATVVQWFCATNEDVERPQKLKECEAYQDTTTKEIEIILKVWEDIKGKYCVVLLGDITVKSTK